MSNRIGSDLDGAKCEREKIYHAANPRSENSKISPYLVRSNHREGQSQIPHHRSLVASRKANQHRYLDAPIEVREPALARTVAASRWRLAS